MPQSHPKEIESSSVKSMKRTAADIEDDLYDLQLALHEHPEVAFHEESAHDRCTEYMERQGFKVTRHAFGIKTAWKAEYEQGSGGPVIGFNSEMDALSEIGHACGHNLICIAGISGAVSTARWLKEEQVSGKVILLGTPAEESGGGKVYLIDRGAYDEMEVCLMAHANARGQGLQVPGLAASFDFSVRFHGRSTHTGATPELGINALDAAVAAYNNLSLLRQQTKSGSRIYGIIKGSEAWSLNVIPSESEFKFGLRCETADEAFDLAEKLLACAKAAATATGCTYDIRREHLYLNLHQEEELCSYLQQSSADQLGYDAKLFRRGTMSATSDFGNVSYHLPALHPMFDLPEAKDGDNLHSNTFAESTSSRSATQAAIRAGTALSVVGIRIITDREWAKSVRASWEHSMKVMGRDGIMKKLRALTDAHELAPEDGQVECCGLRDTKP